MRDAADDLRLEREALKEAVRKKDESILWRIQVIEGREPDLDYRPVRFHEEQELIERRERADMLRRIREIDEILGAVGGQSAARRSVPHAFQWQGTVEQRSQLVRSLAPRFLARLPAGQLADVLAVRLPLSGEYDARRASSPEEAPRLCWRVAQSSLLFLVKRLLVPAGLLAYQDDTDIAHLVYVNFWNRVEGMEFRYESLKSYVRRVTNGALHNEMLRSIVGDL
jgi:hypothetical protein